MPDTGGYLAAAQDVMAAHLEGEAILLHLGRQRYFRLNRTGAHIWRGIEARKTLDEITQSLVDAFDVTHAEAEASMRALVADLLENTLVCEHASDA